MAKAIKTQIIAQNIVDFDIPDHWMDFNMSGSPTYLKICPGMELQIKGVILESDCYEAEVLNLFREIADSRGMLYDEFCPDNDNISWEFKIGHSFHGIPIEYGDIMLHFEIPGEYHKDGSFALEADEIATFFTITLTDYAS